MPSVLIGWSIQSVIQIARIDRILMITTSEPEVMKESGSANEPDRNLSSLPLFGVVLFFLTTNALWKWFDSSIPVWDSASHVLYGYRIVDIFNSDASFFPALLQALKISFYYPPFFYYVHSAVMLVTGTCGEVIDQIPSLAFFALSLVSLYLLGCELINDKRASLIGTVLFACTPAVNKAVHPIALLDLPLTAMVFTGLLCLVRWRKDPSWSKAILAGVVIGLTALTKQYGIFFFIPVMGTWFVIDLVKKEFAKIVMSLSLAAIAALVFLVWLVPNLEELIPFMATNHRQGEEGNFFLMWLNNVQDFMPMFQLGLTFPCLVTFILSCYYWQTHKKLWIISVSSLFCMAIICGLNWDPYQFRYILPVVGYYALATGWLVSNMIAAKSPIYFKAFGLSVMTWALFSYVYLNFSPYPISMPQSVVSFVDKIPGIKTIKGNSKFTEPVSAVPHEDWGYDWLFRTIEDNKRSNFSYVCVLPDTFNYSCLGMYYQARSREQPMVMRTLRKWTTKGYEFSYSQKDFDYYDWFIVLQDQVQKDGAVFANAEARQNYENLKKKLDTDSTFEKFGGYNLPDGSSVVLYQNHGEFHPKNNYNYLLKRYKEKMLNAQSK